MTYRPRRLLRQADGHRKLAAGLVVAAILTAAVDRGRGAARPGRGEAAPYDWWCCRTAIVRIDPDTLEPTQAMRIGPRAGHRGRRRRLRLGYARRVRATWAPTLSATQETETLTRVDPSTGEVGSGRWRPRALRTAQPTRRGMCGSRTVSRRDGTPTSFGSMPRHSRSRATIVGACGRSDTSRGHRVRRRFAVGSRRQRRSIRGYRMLETVSGRPRARAASCLTSSPPA